jgi:hypothetical protein
MGHQLPYREVEPEPPPGAWPMRRILLWGLLFAALGSLAFVGWALTTP